MSAPLIGVSTSVTIDESPERAYVNAAYLRAVEQAARHYRRAQQELAHREER